MRLLPSQLVLPLLLLGAARLPLASPPPSPTPRGRIEGITSSNLWHQLAIADASWAPRLAWQSDGKVALHYRRRLGEPPLSLWEIFGRMRQPPRFAAERAAIQELLAVLNQAGIRIQITPPRQSRAAGEWEPSLRVLRVHPSVLQGGTLELARVLNHEALHVAQSCRNGSISAFPVPLGLPDRLPTPIQGVMADPLYRRASADGQRLEREAYAAQDQLRLGALWVRRMCHA